MTAVTRYTVDASVLVKLVVEEEYSSNALKLVSKSVDDDDEGVVLYAPDLIYYEIGSVLHKMVRRNIIKQDYAAQAYAKLLKLSLEVTNYQQQQELQRRGGDNNRLLSEVFEISGRLGTHFYDAFYIHTAKLTKSALVSSDKKLLNTAKKECDSVNLADI
jgi:predicted nucleic acid-binding protein